MEIIQKINSVNCKPRKIRLLTRQIKRVELEIIRDRLKLADHKVSLTLVKGIDAAIDRIKHASLNPSDFILSRITIDEGLKLKRRQLASKGRSKPITKQRSNINIFITQKVKHIENNK